MSTQLTAHSELIDSELAWIGSVPKHWKLLPARVAVSNLADKNDGAKNQDYLSLVAGIGVMPYADKGDMGNKKPDDLSKCKLVRKGNIVINSMNYFIGAYGMSSHEGVCSPVYIVLDVNQAVMERRFALRLFGTTGFQLYLATFGNGILEHRAAIGWDDIKGAYVPVPPIFEQKQIAKFLDYETAKVDALIEKQQQLIALLKEKRQAVISHAVTKGLNPDAPMRDSGVEWLGEVPAHWTVAPLKHHARKFEQGWSPQCDQRAAEQGEWGVLKVGCVNGGIFNIHENKYLPENERPRREYLIAKGDLLVSRANTRELVGSAAVVREETPNLLLCDKLYRLRLDELTNAQFVAYYIGTSLVRQQIELEATGASHSMVNIGQGVIRNLPTPIPPEHEARTIVASLEQALLAIDGTVAKGGTQMELLRERRTALISAAVTGKIDVRGWKPPESTIESQGA